MLKSGKARGPATCRSTGTRSASSHSTESRSIVDAATYDPIEGGPGGGGRRHAQFPALAAKVERGATGYVAAEKRLYPHG